MLQLIKIEHYFDSEGCNLKDGDQDDRQTYMTDILDKNTLILTFYGCLEAK